MEEFLDNYIDSFIAWDLIVFFHTNSGVIDTPSGLAARLGRHEDEVKRALEQLCQKGVLGKKHKDATLYFYTPSEEIKKDIDHFVRSLDNRSFRLQILSALLRRGVR
jgi:hypothetical protein